MRIFVLFLDISNSLDPSIFIVLKIVTMKELKLGEIRRLIATSNFATVVPFIS